MQRGRKISSGPDLQPILENGLVVEVFEDNDVFKSPRSSMNIEKTRLPPQVPGSSSCLDDRLDYVNNAITWLREELTDLKQQDKNLMHAYKHLIGTVSTLKKMNTTFQEQLNVIDKMNTKEESPTTVDLPRLDSSELRYNRIGQLERHSSYS